MTSELTTLNLPANRPSPQELFDYPQYTIPGITTWEQVVLLGSKNIGAMISRCRSREKELTSRIQRLVEKQKLLEGKSGDDIKEMAKGFENPTITETGVPDGSWNDDLEPTDGASKARERGATTFNICGWCTHAGGGTCRYGYYIKTSCGLMHGDSPETAFNTPCLLQEMGNDQITAIVERTKNLIMDTKELREKVRTGIRILQQLKENEGSTEKPYLMSLRPHDHFNVGDDVMVRIGGHDNVIVEGEWAPAMVVFGYRHHDGCVSTQTLFPIHNGENLEGRGWGFGMSRPECLLRSEFSYLRDAFENDLWFLRLWLQALDEKLTGFNPVSFRKALQDGAIADPPEDWDPPVDEIAVRSVEDAQCVLQMLNVDLFDTEEKVRGWVNMQLQFVHPDKHANGNKGAQSYAERQTKAVYAARDLLIQRLRDRQS